ncbi:TPA: LacI family DNA-binding transcriptional regulator [Escherichia coli]|jgi:LacI family kdg operon repressor|nr:LacI family DNA-binding transcriptional regulator [Escherichia coli]EBH1757211.1 LacI family transcriptional regulator [Salmonella enterica]EFX0809817.1 LacI family transcriptional regulator [Shigella sonnei]EFN7524147.1 LacI family transcriptional regulator [Escherichia coli]EFN7907000.1 LacI family transcriptional regulator [Escherichia coli]EFN7920912.1 LacI family transcriptional regulator [Escherichia coli]
MNKSSSISDVAQLAKVGKTSVSRYLNGEHHLLSEKLKERIKNAIEVLDYTPNPLARSLKNKRSKLIGLLLADINNPYSVRIINSVEKYCWENDFVPIVFNTDNSFEKESKALDILNRYQVEGVVINTVNSSKPFGEYRFPVVLIDRKIPGKLFDMVGLDNYHAVNTAVQHLVNEGFDDILFISEPVMGVHTRLERQRAFYNSSRCFHDIQYHAQEIGCLDIDGIEKILLTFCDKRINAKRKAIISANGALTISLIKVINYLNIRIGVDVGFLGVDDVEWSEIIGGGITIIKQPTDLIGSAAMELLHSRIDTPDIPSRDAIFHGDLIIRQSTINLSRFQSK